MATHTADSTIIISSGANRSTCDTGLVRGAIGMAIISVAFFGLLYPLAGVGLGQALFPQTANGSLIVVDGKILGSALVAQPFADARYFHPRPSAAAYEPMALAGSNQSRTNPELRKRIEALRADIAQRNGVSPEEVPSDLVTQSGAGIDPHISAQAAALQSERVARARGLDRAAVDALVARHIEGRQFGLLGQPRVNVLEVNLALDALTPSPSR